MLITSVVAYSTRKFVVMGSNPGQVIFLLSCSRHVVILHYTKNYYAKVVYIPKIYDHTLLYDPIASGASVPPHKFVRPPG
jgi:hypothetical protein